ncbi:sugar phosphate isomerase/epimerase family protein [Puniceicoccus vermicola]|uniref:Sugar phosphate isomerase/epimerase n=1 Tax=Puniceicoccus vermicola TaxID=388746 RepID=A0A7X1B0T4_9BACT|nr:sugar phosphate isomerase/epimerase family protein [Puniceicoccus vermicola]MBC2603482.1 sugar phosphate isomerase/epimerase [Puniceicoccus vermicola]
MLSSHDIRIGTLAGKGNQTPDYIAKILPHGFESFQINFWQTLGDVDLHRLSTEVSQVLDGHDAIISSLGIFGNPLESDDEAEATRKGWEACIDHAYEFGTDLVCGFAGRVRDVPVPDSLSRYKEVFGPLAQRAADKGVRIAFENCPMGGSWQSGDWNIAFNPKAWDMMFNELEAKNIGLEWEPCHQMTQLIDPLPQLKKYLPKIFHIHGKDATIHGDVLRETGIFGPQPVIEHRHPGFGDSNWTDIISELRRGGYTSTIDIEGWHDPVYKDELEMTGQVRALQYLKECRGTYVSNPEGF